MATTEHIPLQRAFAVIEADRIAIYPSRAQIVGALIELAIAGLAMTALLTLFDVLPMFVMIALLLVALAVLPLSIMGFAAINPSLQGILSLSTRESDQGEVLGLGQGLSALARILGPAVGIALCKPDHIYWPHISAAAFMAIALIIMVGIPGRTSQAVASSVE